MAHKDTVLIVLFLALTLLSVSVLYYRSVVLEDFEIMSNDNEVTEE